METKRSDQKISGQELARRLDLQPLLMARVSQLLSLVENADSIERADEAERCVIKQLRDMGQELLTVWAESRAGQVDAEMKQPGIGKHQKKTLLAQHLRPN